MSCNAAYPSNLGLLDFPVGVNDQSSYDACTTVPETGADETWDFTPVAGTEVWVSVQHNPLPDSMNLYVQEGDCGSSNGLCTGFSENPSNEPDAVSFIATGSQYFFSVDSTESVFNSWLDPYLLTVGCPVPCNPGLDVAQSLTCSSDIIGETTAGDCIDC